MENYGQVGNPSLADRSRVFRYDVPVGNDIRSFLNGGYGMSKIDAEKFLKWLRIAVILIGALPEKGHCSKNFHSDDLPVKIKNAVENFRTCLRAPTTSLSVDSIGDTQKLTCGVDMPQISTSQLKIISQCLESKKAMETQMRSIPSIDKQRIKYLIHVPCKKLTSFSLEISESANETYKVESLGFVIH